LYFLIEQRVGLFESLLKYTWNICYTMISTQKEILKEKLIRNLIMLINQLLFLFLLFLPSTFPQACASFLVGLFGQLDHSNPAGTSVSLPVILCCLLNVLHLQQPTLKSNVCGWYLGSTFLILQDSGNLPFPVFCRSCL
jgi:hypothetical protein